MKQKRAEGRELGFGAQPRERMAPGLNLDYEVATIRVSGRREDSTWTMK